MVAIRKLVTRKVKLSCDLIFYSSMLIVALVNYNNFYNYSGNNTIINICIGLMIITVCYAVISFKFENKYSVYMLALNAICFLIVLFLLNQAYMIHTGIHLDYWILDNIYGANPKVDFQHLVINASNKINQSDITYTNLNYNGSG